MRFMQVIGWAPLHVRTCTPHLRILRTDEIWCLGRDLIVTGCTEVEGGVTASFACPFPVSLSQKPLSPDPEATPKTHLSISRSLFHRQASRLTGRYSKVLGNVQTMYCQKSHIKQVTSCSTCAYYRARVSVFMLMAQLVLLPLDVDRGRHTELSRPHQSWWLGKVRSGQVRSGKITRDAVS